MNKWLWLGGAAVAAAAALGTWWAATSPAFWAGLSAIAVGAIWKAVGPFLRAAFHASTETIKAAKKRTREGIEPHEEHWRGGGGRK